VATAELFESFNAQTIDWFGSIVNVSPTHFQMNVGVNQFNYLGSGFALNGTGRLISGTVESIDYTSAGALQFRITGLNHSAVVLDVLLRGNNGLNGQAIEAFLFAGDDLIFGSNSNDTVNGSAGDDGIAGAGGNDTLRGDIGNDVFEGGPGNDTIDGGAGVDFAFYAGIKNAYATAGTATGVQVTNSVGNEGIDLLTGVERLIFSDRNVAFDLGLGQSAGNAVRILGAAFDQAGIIPEYTGIAIDLFDAGFSMEQVAELALSTPLFGSRSSIDFVNKVYTNVVGGPPTIPERDAFVALLQESGGPLSQAQLLAIAANSDFNAVNIGLTGLQLTGAEYLA
jgi:Ca2+-binding RTX toxin-like protein